MRRVRPLRAVCDFDEALMFARGTAWATPTGPVRCWPRPAAVRRHRHDGWRRRADEVEASSSDATYHRRHVDWQAGTLGRAALIAGPPGGAGGHRPRDETRLPENYVRLVDVEWALPVLGVMPP